MSAFTVGRLDKMYKVNLDCCTRAAVTGNAAFCQIARDICHHIVIKEIAVSFKLTLIAG